ncbi:MAG: bifunctional nicotinamidase/pyrazinamidase [Pseudomonadota bacterium]
MRALLLVDLQYDFMPGGALAVREGDATVAVATSLLPRFERVFATQDWHPENHGSFASNHPGHSPGECIELHGLSQVLWPAHCVQGTHGAELHADLDPTRLDAVVAKGTDPAIDSYSGFFDNGQRKATDLDAVLRGHGVDALVILGLATDYCVKFTVLDACRLGYRVRVVEEGCRAVDLRAGDGDRAYEQMREAGAHVVRASELG